MTEQNKDKKENENMYYGEKKVEIQFAGQWLEEEKEARSVISTGLPH